MVNTEWPTAGSEDTIRRLIRLPVDRFSSEPHEKSRPKPQAPTLRKEKPPTRAGNGNSHNTCKQHEWYSPPNACNCVADVINATPYGKTDASQDPGAPGNKTDVL
jgi:hypothetical protein